MPGVSEPRRAVFLDRDGVLVRARVVAGRPHPPPRLEDLELLPEAQPACELLHEAGFVLVVVTNQPDIARGTQSPETVERMHAILRERLPIDDIRVCPHDDADECGCRKPKPGMLLDAAAEHGLLLEQSYLVGDRWRDVECAARAGCTPILVDRGYDERRPDSPCLVTTDLASAVRLILAGSGTRAFDDA